MKKVELPLSALLSQAFVAFVIEFDNEFEHQAPHRTTNHRSTPGAPWLVSWAMWDGYLQHVPDEGISFAELQTRRGVSKKALNHWLIRLGKWWRYLAFDPPLPSKNIPPETIIRPTAGGRRAIEVWRPLTAVIEKRWRERFGADAIGRLEDDLRAIADELDPEAADSFPIIEGDKPRRKTAAKTSPKMTNLTLPRLMAKALVEFALEFDRYSVASLSITANILRVVGEEGVRVRDLPRLACLAKEGAALEMRIAERQGLASVESGKLVKLTAKGCLGRDMYLEKAREVEEAWRRGFGRNLRISLESLAPRFLEGIVYYPDGWRSSIASLEGLPHFPMISHRGGYPDGS